MWWAGWMGWKRVQNRERECKEATDRPPEHLPLSKQKGAAPVHHSPYPTPASHPFGSNEHTSNSFWSVVTLAICPTAQLTDVAAATVAPGTSNATATATSRHCFELDAVLQQLWQGQTSGSQPISLTFYYTYTCHTRTHTAAIVALMVTPSDMPTKKKIK